MGHLHHVRKLLSAAILVAWFSCLLTCEAKCALGDEAEADGDLEVCSWVASSTLETSDRSPRVNWEVAAFDSDFFNCLYLLPVARETVSRFSFCALHYEFGPSWHFLNRSAAPPRAPSFV